MIILHAPFKKKNSGVYLVEFVIITPLCIVLMLLPFWLYNLEKQKQDVQIKAGNDSAKAITGHMSISTIITNNRHKELDSSSNDYDAIAKISSDLTKQNLNFIKYGSHFFTSDANSIIKSEVTDQDVSAQFTQGSDEEFNMLININQAEQDKSTAPVFKVDLSSLVYQETQAGYHPTNYKWAGLMGFGLTMSNPNATPKWYEEKKNFPYLNVIQNIGCKAGLSTLAEFTSKLSGASGGYLKVDWAQSSAIKSVLDAFNCFKRYGQGFHRACPYEFRAPDNCLLIDTWTPFAEMMLVIANISGVADLLTGNSSSAAKAAAKEAYNKAITSVITKLKTQVTNSIKAKAKSIIKDKMKAMIPGRNEPSGDKVVEEKKGIIETILTFKVPSQKSINDNIADIKSKTDQTKFSKIVNDMSEKL